MFKGITGQLKCWQSDVCVERDQEVQRLAVLEKFRNKSGGRIGDYLFFTTVSYSKKKWPGNLFNNIFVIFVMKFLFFNIEIWTNC